MLSSLGGWFYKGKSGATPVAHWIFHVEEVPACGRLKPSWFVWRHHIHDQHIPKCKHCQRIVEPIIDPKTQA